MIRGAFLSTFIAHGLPAVAAISAVVATAILSLRPDLLFDVFLLYGASNASWIAHAVRKREWWLVLQNMVFAVLTVIGLVRNWS